MVDFDAIAMAELERMYPEKIKRFDELYAKEKAGTISRDEKVELDMLDRELLREFDRVKLHYMLNWQFMSRERKKELIEAIKDRSG